MVLLLLLQFNQIFIQVTFFTEFTSYIENAFFFPGFIAFNTELTGIKELLKLTGMVLVRDFQRFEYFL